MNWTKDDPAVDQLLSQSMVQYVGSLTDSHGQYTRFFDALLIPRRSHPAFFRDLKGFRNLHLTIQALARCDPLDITSSKEQRKENYKDVTKKFLNSRYAHPWCRKAMAGMGNTKIGGWWGAEWTATGRKMSKEQRDQEDKLHKLLVPLWVRFRAIMFPGPELVEEWWRNRQTDTLVNQSGSSLVLPDDSHKSGEHDGGTEQCTELIMGTHKSPYNEVTREVGYASEDDDEEGGEEGGEHGPRSEAPVLATGLLRLAVASVMVDSMSKMQKWKLKRELNRQMRR